MRIMIDTNIILDACLSRAPWHTFAEKIILACAEEKIRGYITASSVTDIYYILKKALHDRDVVRETMRKLFMIIEVLDVNGTDCEKAFGSTLPDYEDALMACCAQRHRTGWIVTRNPKHFEGAPVSAISPEAFVKDYC
jgi:predicted nucleic acid-binding protein